MLIFLIRHAQSTGNGRASFLGWSDHPLSELGLCQAEAVAARLAPLGPMPVYCSDLQRARVTAERIASRWDGAVIPDVRWRETHCGELEDCPWDDFTRNEELQRLFDADPFNAVMPGGESVAMMAGRVLSAFDNLCRLPAERAVVVTHGGPIRVVLARCLDIPYAKYWALEAAHGGITVLSITPEWISVRGVNDVGHLAGVG